jgi:hypothetical protein
VGHSIAEELLLAAYDPDGTARGRSIELDCAAPGELVPGEHAARMMAAVVATVTAGSGGTG